MKRIFGIRFAEMRDIENVRDAIFDKINEHCKATDHDFKVIENRIKDIDRTITDKTGDLSTRIQQVRLEVLDLQETTNATERVLNALIDETLTHLPVKKNAANLVEYHRKRLEKALTPKE